MTSQTSIVSSARIPSALARAMRTADTIEVEFSSSNAQNEKTSLAALPFFAITGSFTNPADCMTDDQRCSARPSRCE